MRQLQRLAFPAEPKQPLAAEEFNKQFSKGGFRRTVNVLRGYGANQDLSEETAQAAWVRGWERLGQLKDPALLGQWINRIAINLVRDEIKKNRRLTAMLPAGPGPEALPAVSVSAIDFHIALERCSPDRRILIEAVLTGHTTTEIAASLNISVGATLHRLSRARRALRKALTTF